MTTLRFSLVLSTIGRKQDLTRFCTSLCGQTYRDFELILVDQSEGDDLIEIVRHFGGDFRIIHLRSERGLSRGRNVGLKAATGSLIGFPDDDCWYGAEFLERIAEAFESSANLDVLSGVVLDETGAPVGSWDRQSGALTRANVWRRAMSMSIFLRRRAAEAVGEFDERLGVGSGTTFSAAEETDYVVRAIDQGYVSHFDPTLVAYHPNKKQSVAGMARAYEYGAGMGFVLAKHRYAKTIVCRYLMRPLLGTMIYLATGRFYKAHYQYRTLRGRWWGFRAGRRLARGGPRFPGGRQAMNSTFSPTSKLVTKHPGNSQASQRRSV